jgi:hypothetical protein
VLMRLQQARLHPHRMESNPAWAQTGVTILERIHFHRVRAQYQPPARLEPIDLDDVQMTRGALCCGAMGAPARAVPYSRSSSENRQELHLWYYFRRAQLQGTSFAMTHLDNCGFHSADLTAACFVRSINRFGAYMYCTVGRRL